VSKQQKIFTEEFKREAVRLTRDGGRTIEQVAQELGVGRSSLTHWRRQYREPDLLAGSHEDPAKELERLRRENEILRQERELLKRVAAYFVHETSR